MPTVTIGLPFHNQAQFLNAAIQSVMNQTCSDWELILLDDGSTDTSLAIASAWLTDPRVRLISSSQRLGLASRLNQITALATGQFIARMDADDLMAPTRIQNQVAYLMAHPYVDLLASFAYVMDKVGNVYGLRGNASFPESYARALQHGFPIVHPTVIGRITWFRRYSYNQNLVRTEDIDLWLRTYKQSTFHILPTPLLYYREHSTALNYGIAMAEYRLLLNHYRLHLSSFSYRRNWILSHYKHICLALAETIGVLDWALRRRSQRLLPQQYPHAQKQLHDCQTYTFLASTP